MKRTINFLPAASMFSLLFIMGACTTSQHSDTPDKTLTIGEQEWMLKNLDVSTFRNGDPIPEAKTKEEWITAYEEGKPAWCYFNNDSSLGTKYGRLYNVYAAHGSEEKVPTAFITLRNQSFTREFCGSIFT